VILEHEKNLNQSRIVFDSETDRFLVSPRTRCLLRREVPRLINTHVAQGGPPTNNAPGRRRSTSCNMLMNPRLGHAWKHSEKNMLHMYFKCLFGISPNKSTLFIKKALRKYYYGKQGGLSDLYHVV